LSGGSIPGNGSCAVSVNVTSDGSGTLVNSTGVVSSGNSGSAGAATAALDVDPVTAPTLSPLGLALLGSLLLFAAAFAVRERAKRPSHFHGKEE